ncbi:MAG: hypothetical protein QNJ97_03315 [Myxococcota bacterium]|nr:hypothetical protein [Myxococcota bacterium]
MRLYPIPLRYQDVRIHKYQWIEVDLEPVGHGNDNRKESRKPDLSTLWVLGDPIGCKDEWRERRQFIDRLPHHTYKQLEEQHELDKSSLGIIRPKEILDVTIEKADPEWKPEWQAALNQMSLFGPPTKPLEKLPFKWSYVFQCEDREQPYSRMIEDWELGALYLKERDSKGEEGAAKSVRDKYLSDIGSPKRDTRFFMGTRFPFNTWLVLGTFWPPKTTLELF